MNSLRATARLRSLTPRRCLRTSTPHLSTEPIDIDQLLSKPTWSISSLLPPSDTRPTDSPSISSKQLHHLLRLSALPPPSSPEEEARMLSTLASQLHFVREIQRVDTAGVEPLTSLRDETPEGEKEAEIGLEQLKDAMDREEVKGKALRRIRRRRGGGLEKEVEHWDMLGMAGKKSGRYFVVEGALLQTDMNNHKSNTELASDLEQLVEDMREHALDQNKQLHDLLGQVRQQNRRLDGLLDAAGRARAREGTGHVQATRDDDDSQNIDNASLSTTTKHPTAAQKPLIAPAPPNPLQSPNSTPPTSEADAQTLRTTLATLAEFKSKLCTLAIRSKFYVAQFGVDEYRWTERERGLFGIIAELAEPLAEITGVDRSAEHERCLREVVEAVGDGESRAFGASGAVRR
ncbi:Glu-tRNAGln amidotransferase C subunit [Teratosphaeria destructans]|uniref:Glu-tRNAGln amidotransferase C subunit n=1 Tax=Teratosphaeria destructans TaxID=418781 RepID=A0A9W7VYH9_9PEZI|nr:Glu-tRNAGln amidotransferase C subunit [Teratosphaeria destructans]